MTLHSGLDTVGIISTGNWTKTFGSASPASIANILISFGLLENAPNLSIIITNIMMYYIRRRTNEQ